MEQLQVTCLSCDQGWSLVASSSVHEQQALESCPCPFCGAYTLCAENEVAQESPHRPMLVR